MRQHLSAFFDLSSPVYLLFNVLSTGGGKIQINNILQELKKHGCSIYADSKIKKLYKGKAKLASERIWSKEFLSAKISVKLVNDINEAIYHINKYGTMHTDAIITKNKNSA